MRPGRQRNGSLECPALLAMAKEHFLSGIDPAEVAACQDTGYVVRARSGHFFLRMGQI